MPLDKIPTKVEAVAHPRIYGISVHPGGNTNVRLIMMLSPVWADGHEESLLIEHIILS